MQPTLATPIGAISPVAAIQTRSSRSVGRSPGQVTIDTLNVDATGGDSKEIAQNVGSALKTQLQNTVEDLDSDIER